MKTLTTPDPIRRMDEIVQELTSLYSEDANLLDAYVDHVCLNAGIPEDIVRERARRRLEDA